MTRRGITFGDLPVTERPKPTPAKPYARPPNRPRPGDFSGKTTIYGGGLACASHAGDVLEFSVTAEAADVIDVTTFGDSRSRYIEGSRSRVGHLVFRTNDEIKPGDAMSIRADRVALDGVVTSIAIGGQVDGALISYIELALLDGDDGDDE